jgi:hypothetical protein
LIIAPQILYIQMGLFYLSIKPAWLHWQINALSFKMIFRYDTMKT